MLCKAQNIEDYEKSIIYFLGFAWKFDNGVC